MELIAVLHRGRRFLALAYDVAESSVLSLVDDQGGCAGVVPALEVSVVWPREACATAIN